MLRRASFYLLSFLIGTVAAVLVGELLVRLWVAPEQLWVVGKSNIYRSVPNESLGFTYKPNLDRSAFGVDLITNDLGFRGPVWDSGRHSESCRIALIGDSHAFGFGVAYEETAGQVLARELSSNGQRVSVWNFGVNGYNSTQELAVYENYVREMSPDVIILMLSGNDHEPARRVDDEGWMYRPSSSSSEWRKSFDKFDPRAEPGRFPRWMRHSHLALYVGIARARLRASRDTESRTKGPGHLVGKIWPVKFEGTTVSERLMETVYSPVRVLISDARRQGIPVVLAYFATGQEYGQLINQVRKEHGIATLNLLSLFPKAHSEKELLAQFSIGWDSHLGTEAHRRWGRALARIVRQKACVE